MINNDGSKFSLENVKITNGEAEDYYLNSGEYTTPYSDTSLTLKKYKPFFTTLLNTYDFTLKDVIIVS